MGNILVTNPVTERNKLDTISVTSKIVNTNCIVCGNAFERPRMGKLYCSSRCKQFGYNHKNEINQALADKQTGINQIPKVFFIEDYTSYDRKRKMLKRYRELERKRLQWESVDQRLGLRQKQGLPIDNYLLECYTIKKLTEDEEGELYEVERNLEDEILNLNPKSLSLEQWSFIKSLYPLLDDLTFIEIVSSLSSEFFEQLILNSNSSKGNSEFLLIKNKFINHCNLIAMGVIQFAKRFLNEGD
ncbi:MAG: hypothetical protein Q8891_17600 [Bacteroidota bacterium]|nr:hypothetical protein [Bacteroidota bacterium]